MYEFTYLLLIITIIMMYPNISYESTNSINKPIQKRRRREYSIFYVHSNRTIQFQYNYYLLYAQHFTLTLEKGVNNNIK